MAASRKSEKEKQLAKNKSRQQDRDLAKASLDTSGAAAAGGAVIADHDSQDMDVDSAAAAAAASSVMQLGGTQQERRVPEFQGPAEGGISDTGALSAQEKMDIENTSRGGGGGVTRRNGGVGRQALGGISESDENSRLSLLSGPSAAARGPPSSVVMRKFPTTRSQIQRI